MVTSGIKSRRMTLTFENSGRITLSVTLRSRPICGFMAACIDAIV